MFVVATVTMHEEHCAWIKILFIHFVILLPHLLQLFFVALKKPQCVICLARHIILVVALLNGFLFVVALKHSMRHLRYRHIIFVVALKTLKKVICPVRHNLSFTLHDTF